MHELGIAHGHGGNKEAYEMSGKLTKHTRRGRMTQFLLFVSTFLDFWFLTFCYWSLGVSLIIEQILRAQWQSE